MANDDYESFLWRASNYNGGKPEVYEDTHDRYGRYVGGKKKHFFGSAQSDRDTVGRIENELKTTRKFKYSETPPAPTGSSSLPGSDQFVSPRLYQNIVFYSPRNASDVEKLIDYIKRREPAIIDLDPIADTDDAQRALDFTSGAVYALSGRIIAMKSNMFLIVPEGVDVAIPDDNT